MSQAIRTYDTPIGVVQVLVSARQQPGSEGRGNNNSYDRHSDLGEQKACRHMLENSDKRSGEKQSDVDLVCRADDVASLGALQRAVSESTDLVAQLRRQARALLTEVGQRPELNGVTLHI